MEPEKEKIYGNTNKENKVTKLKETDNFLVMTCNKLFHLPQINCKFDAIEVGN